jgi:uncharacterized protein YbjT (DUF2867 family)
MKNIFIAGASGYVGSRLVPRLLEKEYRVRCLARYPEKLKSRSWRGVEIVQGDVLKPETLLPALQGMDAAYYLVHAMGNSGDFSEKDALSARNFARAAAEAGLQRIIYLGGLGDEDQNLSEHLKSRREVGVILGQTGIPVTELRASIIIGSGSASFEIIRDLVKKLPLMITPRWVNSLCQPIAVRDVLNYLTGILEEPRTAGQTFDIGGEEKLTYADMMRLVAEVMGKKLFIIHVPVLTPHLSAYWLNLVTTVPMSIAFPLVEGLRNDTVCRDNRIRELLPIALTPFISAVKRALDIEKQHRVESRWTEASSYRDGEILPGKHRWLKDIRVIYSDIAPEKIFARVQKIGGDTGWYYADWAWKLRGILDRLIGGVGMRRGRRHPVDLRVGDPLDFWRVGEFQPGRYLKLRAEMKVPGVAWLEFKTEKNEAGKTVFHQIASFKPHNWFGTAYWYAAGPAHFFIFRNMARRIVQAAGQTSNSNKTAQTETKPRVSV